MPFDGKIADYKTNTTADVLRRARALIDSPEKWCKGALYRDGGRCILGAIYGDGPNVAHTWGEGEIVACATMQKVVGFDIPGFNNAPERTHAEVMAAFDRAIELAEAEG